MRVGCMGILVVDVFTDPIQRLPEAGQLGDYFWFDNDRRWVCRQCRDRAQNSGGKTCRWPGKWGRMISGDFIVSGLKQHGAGVDYVRRSRQLPTSGTVIFTLQGEDRRYLHCIGANARISPEDV